MHFNNIFRQVLFFLLTLFAIQSFAAKSDYFIDVQRGTTLNAESKEFLKTIPENAFRNLTKIIYNSIDGDLGALNLFRAGMDTEDGSTIRLDSKDLLLEASQANIPIKIYYPTKADKLPVLLYFHGGGWALGSIKTCATICQDIAEEANVAVVAVDYRLSPEYRYPAALDDVESAYDYIKENAKNLKLDKDKIFLAGDSAGGYLTFALTDRLIAKNKALPRGLITFYPVANFTNYKEDLSYKKFSSGYALDDYLMDAFCDAYIDEKDRHSASPMNFDSLEKFPPIIIFTSGYDILRDQGIEFVKKLRLNSVSVRHIKMMDSLHIYITVPSLKASYLPALYEAKTFIKSLLNCEYY